MLKLLLFTEVALPESSASADSATSAHIKFALIFTRQSNRGGAYFQINLTFLLNPHYTETISIRIIPQLA